MHRSTSALARFGLRAGEPSRFRRNGRGRPVVGRVVGIETDGSIAIRDADGSARSLRPEAVEIRRPGARGRLGWRLVSEVAITWEQLELFEPTPRPSAEPGPTVRIRRRRPTLFDDDATRAPPRSAPLPEPSCESDGDAPATPAERA